MVHCAETNKEARENAKAAFEWYARKAFEAVASVGMWQSGKTDIGAYAYLKEMMKIDPATINFDYMDQNDMIICGDPHTSIKKVKHYQAAGCQQLLCFMQIYDIPHQKIMDSIKLWGEHVIPYFQ
jgi:alkanesulfonate monooxygenase SsuD/methylene tetrahydromethanopterin reductase-like flavin-dependent oxidoreductase (luciferase family)